MKIIVIGNGGREQAIAWKLTQSSEVNQVFCLPGNGGTAILPKCQNVSIKIDDFAAIASFAQTNNINLVVVGPELPLSLGITDYLQQHNITVFGPTQAGAQIEASKSWSKDFMIEAGIPTAKSATFTDTKLAKEYVNKEGAPIVIKADGLAAGKGVVVAVTVEEALAAIDNLSANIGGALVIEECLIGQEVSVLAFTDGITIKPLLPAQDHKRIGDGDTGANTGGMGAYAPAPIADSTILAQVQKQVLEPAIATFQKRGIDYKGILYAGLMISPDKQLKVLEFNCRFGDPETQAILPLLETPLEQIILACTEQKLAQTEIKWKPEVCVTVVIASGGYPENYEKGKIITGIEQAKKLGTIVFHAGTKLQEQLLTDGGRVLAVTATGNDFKTAIATAYQGVEAIKFDQMYYRKDIAYRVKGH
jgi:phosphoribosylamine---glycine ligase